MAAARAKSLRDPDETIRFPGITESLVQLGELTVGRVVQGAGWRYSTDMRPLVGEEWCQARHVGVMISGRQGFLYRDGTSQEFGPDDVYDIAPGHDGYTVGDEDAVMIEWSGLRTWAGRDSRFPDRVLVTLLFTDLVESTLLASRVGDTAWRELLASHYESVRAELERYRGREVVTTGDGLLATFDGAARALRCAAAIRASSVRDGLHVRAGVHVGEVEFVGTDVRGLAVHEAARILAAAGPDEILVSEPVRGLAAGAGLAFEDRGLHDLKGLPDPRRLFAYVESGG